MTAREQIYKCALCGNVVNVVHAAAGELVCCGQPMNLLSEQSADSSTEKHVPVIEQVEGGVKATVGSVPHPMADEHFIEWIEIQHGDTVSRQYLKPGAAPEAFFPGVQAADVTAREYCNVHGLWKS
jgi:superoxide reductase